MGGLNPLTIALAFGVPIAIWLLSYAYLAAYHKKWNLFPVPIHENGRLTLLGTIFYFNHFMREIFIDTFYALAAYQTYRLAQPQSVERISSNLVLPSFVGFMVFVIVGSLRHVGLENTLLDLFQFRELDHAVRFGSHWQMHFLSTFAVMLLLLLPATFFGSRFPMEAAFLLLIFLLVSFFFRTGRLAISDPRWLMHGAREVATFVVLAVIPVYAWVFEHADPQPSALSFWVAAAIAGILLYYLVVFRKVDLGNLAQGGYGILYLLASHFFEHVLDFVYMILLLLLLLRIGR